MKVMILAAGRGERLRPLTDTCPKPLMRIGKTTLIEHLIKQLRMAGFTEIIINTFYFAKQIQKKLQDGQSYGVSIQYSDEFNGGTLLDTGGGVRQALPLLGKAPFLVVSSDIWTDFPFQILFNKTLEKGDLTHLVFVPNTQSKVDGIFNIVNNRVKLNGLSQYTYANIGIFSPECFKHTNTVFPLSDIIKKSIILEKASGEIYKRLWYNVGKPEELQVIQQLANKRMHL